jgi:hypothetical protein
MSNNQTNDPFEEFEFKPLTEGLGFHRRKSEAETPTPPPSMGLKSPLPRPQTTPSVTVRSNSGQVITPRITVPMIEDDSISKAQTAVNEILKNLNHKKQQEEIHLKNKKKLVWIATPPSFLACFLDGMLILAGFLLMLIAMLTVTGADLISNLSHPGENSLIWMATGHLLLSIYVIYMVACRAYLGYTPGEWAFDQRCGSEIQQASASYIPRVMLRTFLVVITGVVPLTLVSQILGRDIAGEWSRLGLQKKSLV